MSSPMPRLALRSAAACLAFWLAAGAATADEPIDVTGTTVLDVAVAPDGTWYAATDRGIYRRNEDENWHLLADLVLPEIIALADGTVIGGDGGVCGGPGDHTLWRSEDAGDSWSMGHAADGAPLAATPLGEARGLLWASHCGLVRSADRGANWERDISAIAPFGGVAFEPGGRTLYLADAPDAPRSRVMRYMVGGGGRVVLERSAHQSLAWYADHLYSAALDGVVRSRDGGYTWTPVNDGLETLVTDGEARLAIGDWSPAPALAISHGCLVLAGQTGVYLWTGTRWHLIPDVAGPIHDLASAPGALLYERERHWFSIDWASPAVPIECADAAEPLMLEPIVLVPTYGHVRSRYQLDSGAYVQQETGCGEWRSGGTALLVRWDDVLSDWAGTRFAIGPVAEIAGHALVESHHQVGSDGGEEFELPPGCRFTIHDHAGSIFCTRVLTVELEDGHLRSPGWDTFAPATAGEHRFVVVALAGTEQSTHRHTWGRLAREVLLWEIGSETTVSLGEIWERPHYRIGETDVFVRIGLEPDHRYLAVSGTTGAIREVSAAEADLPGRSYRFRGGRYSPLSGSAPSEWMTADGRPILVENWRGESEAPVSGGCSALDPGPYWTEGLLFTNQGVFRWPAEVGW